MGERRGVDPAGRGAEPRDLRTDGEIVDVGAAGHRLGIRLARHDDREHREHEQRDESDDVLPS